MRVTFDKKDLDAVLKASKTVGDIVPLIIDGNRATFTAVDPAHVMMISMNVPVIGDGERKAPLPVSAKSLADVMAFKGDNVEIILTDRVVMRCGNGTRNTLPIASTAAPKTPKIAYTVKVTLSSDTLSEVIKASSGLCDNITFEAKDGKLVLRAGNLGDAIEATVSDAAVGAGRAIYPSDYLSDVIRAFGKVDFQIEFGTDVPCKFSWDANDRAGMALLAPRIEKD